VAWEDRQAALADADFVVSSTSGTQPVITAYGVGARAGRPLLIVDLAVPRDVAPGVAEVSGVTVVDLNALAEAVPPSPEHLAGIARARAIVAAETDRFVVWRKIHAPGDAAAFGFEGA
jgi:glutamyl-tRNA reductase